MAAQEKSPPKQSMSFIARLARLPVHLLAWILGSLLISLLIEWVLMTFVWYDEGSAHSRQVLINEWTFINSNFTQSFFGNASPSELAISITNYIYYWTFTWTGLEAGLSAIGGEYIKASINISQVFFIRLSITIASLPLFVLFAYWGFFEGLVRRELRRYGSDYERGMVYHIAKYMTGAIIILPVIFYLTIPITLNPVFIFLPFAGLLAIVLMVVSTTFTKYI